MELHSKRSRNMESGGNKLTDTLK